MAVGYQELLDLNIVVSTHLKQWMVERGADPLRIHTCYINVDADTWRPDPERRSAVRQELGVEDEVPVVLYAGRICEQKQPRVFAQTMLRLLQESVSYAAIVAGDGPDMESLRSFVKKHKLTERVRLLGAVSNARVRELMAASDVFFLPSKWEGIALSIYEAMACGLPIVGTDVGGQRELVTAECGVLVMRCEEEVEAERHARVLAELLQKPDRRQQMGQASRERVRTHFRLEQMGEQVLSLLLEGVRLHKSQPRPVPSLGVGRVCASQAIESTRISEALDSLRWEHEHKQNGMGPLYPHLLDPYSDSWRTLTYFTVRRLLLPYYRAALNRDITWILPLKNRFKRVLLRDSQIQST